MTRAGKLSRSTTPLSSNVSMARERAMAMPSAVPAAIGAVTLSKLPAVVVTLREGARTLDRDLADMARSFHFGRWRTFRHVTLPQLSPYFLISSRTGLSLIWKIVLVVELLGRPDGIGYAIQVFFQLFDVRRLIAYALAFVAVVLAVEWGVLQPLERRLARWRR